MEFRRYAVYFTPPPGPLARFGADWLGWDPQAGRECPHPVLPGLPLPVASLTEEPRKYGFHATLRAPFRLAEGCGQEDLVAAVGDISARQRPVMLEGLRLARMAGFVALLPDGDQGALGDLAAGVVRGLDALRAPLNEAELARRRRKPLGPQEEANLLRWGYPHVFGSFRFHMTLTGNLPEAEAGAVLHALAPVLAPLLPRPFGIDALTLLGEARDGRFHVIHRFGLSG